MATYINYTSLFNDVTAYLERGGSSTTDETVYEQIPRLINAAERKICNALKLQGVIESLSDPAGLPLGSSVIAKPDRWRQTVSMWRGASATSNQRAPILPRSLEFCRSYWPNPSSTDGSFPPEFYADYDLQHWLIAPTADQTYPVEVLCYMQPQLLDSTNQTNFFTDYCGNLLLYGSLLESAPFLKNDERLPVWQGLWDREAASLAGQDLQKILDRTADRARP